MDSIINENEIILDENKTDKERMQEFFTILYGSKEYKAKVANSYIKHSHNLKITNVKNKIRFNMLFLLATIFLSVGLILRHAIFYAPVICILPIILLSTKKRTLRRKKEAMYEDLDKSAEDDAAFNRLFKKIKNPPIPREKISYDYVKALVDILNNNRADTIKEADAVYELDCERRRMETEAAAMAAAAAQAKQEAENAKKAAARAQEEADYQRREAQRRYDEYHKKWLDTY